MSPRVYGVCILTFPVAFLSCLSHLHLLAFYRMSVDTEIGRILSSSSLFEVLKFPLPKSVSDFVFPLSVVARSFRSLALLVHPDKCDLADATAAFQLLTHAYETLKSAEKARSYFLTLPSSFDERPRKRKHQNLFDFSQAKKSKHEDGIGEATRTGWARFANMKWEEVEEAIRKEEGSA